MLYSHGTSVPSVCPFSSHIQLWCERSGGWREEWTQISVIKGEKERETERYKETQKDTLLIKKTARQRNRERKTQVDGGE